jgi:hypothetical protein
MARKWVASTARGFIVMLAGAIALAAAPSSAVDMPPPPPSVPGVDIIRSPADASDLFATGQDGSIRHLQSGMICPADFPNVHLWSLQIYAAARRGDDVGCDYARFSSNGRASSKLTIFATRRAPGETLDSVYAGYRDDVTNSFPDAAESAPSGRVDGEDYRAASFTARRSDGELRTELIVGFANGWSLEVRATYPQKPQAAGGTPSADEISLRQGDMQSPYAAFRQALSGMRAGAKSTPIADGRGPIASSAR